MLSMDNTERSIWATQAYYAAFEWPLTPLEIAERLIPASRIGGQDVQPSIGEIVARLSDQDFSRRIEQEKIWAQKWRRMRRKAWWLQAIPYVRGLYASGSLALGNMNEGSDWDVFVIAQAGHLYTARIGLTIAAWLMGALRTKHHRTAPDRFCFNHYVTTDGLAIRHRSLYTAHGLALLVPIIDRQQYLERLWRANYWIGDFRPMPTGAAFVRREVRYSPVLAGIRWIGELLLSWAERPLRRWQQRRIARTPATHARGGRVTASDRELEFHPRSFEATALARYTAALVRAGLGAWQEHDSGLR